jgi:hypothetical protein
MKMERSKESVWELCAHQTLQPYTFPVKHFVKLAYKLHAATGNKQQVTDSQMTVESNSFLILLLFIVILTS